MVPDDLRRQDPRDEGDARGRAIEGLLLRYVDRLNAGETIDRDEIRREHPDIADELFEQLRDYEELGEEVAEDGILGVIGDYQLLRQIGRGGMGVVYEAWENSMDRRVAVKVLPAGLAADSKSFTRFMREARIAGRIHHPNVVSVYSTGVKDETPYYAMEFVDGETLAARLARIRAAEGDAGPNEPRDLANAFAGAAEGLHCAHQQGIIHRDIKPSNLIIDREGRVRILDFGLARLEGQESLTLSGDIVGTPLYMSPEQAQARKIPIDGRTDIFSLGACVYEMATGRPPFQGKTPQDTLSRIIERDPVPPCVLNPRLPPDLETIVLKCLRKDPGDRYRTAEALAQDLRRFARGDPIEARPQSAWEILARRVWRNRPKILAGAIIFALLCIAGGLLLKQAADADRLRRAQYGPRVNRAVAMMHFAQPTTLLGTERARRFDPTGYFVAGVRGRPGPSDMPDPVASAAEELGRLADDVRDRPDACYHLARALLLLGDVEGALREVDRAISRAADFAPARILKRAILQSLGREEEARAELAKAEASTRNEWARAFLDAHKAIDEMRWADAVRVYARVIDLEADGGETYVGSAAELRLGRATALLRAGDFAGAIEELGAVRAQWPEALDPILLIGEALHHDGKPEDADRRFLEFYERTRFKDAAAFGIAVRYFYLEQRARGLRWAEKIEAELLRERTRMPFLVLLARATEVIIAGEKRLAAMPDAPFIPTYVSWAYSMLGDKEKALQMLDLALRAQPEHFLPSLGIGIHVLQQGRLDAAIEYLRASLQIEETLGGRWYLARAHALKGETEEACDEYRQGRKLMTRFAIRNAGWDMVFECDFGPFFERIGRPDEALAVYRRVLETVPDHRPAHRLLSDMLRRTTRPDSIRGWSEFLAWLRGRAEAEDAPPSMLVTLAIALSRDPGRNDPAEVQDLIRRAIERSGGKNPKVLCAPCEILAEIGDPAGAVLALERALALEGSHPRPEFLLARFRRDLLPKIASRESVDAILRDGPLETLVAEEASWAFAKGTQAPSADLQWTKPEFDDRAWPRGAGTFGYGMGNDHDTTLTDMAGRYTSLYLRHRFNLAGARIPGRLRLYVFTTGGFIAYVNGQEVGRIRAGRPGSEVSHDGAASGFAPAIPPLPIEFDGSRLRSGQNCLAIHGLVHRDKRDAFVLNATLVGGSVPDARTGRELLDAFARVADPNDREILRYMEVRLLQIEGKNAEAAAAFSALIERDPECPLLHLRQAEALRDGGQLAEAEAFLREALARFPDRTDLWDFWYEIAAVGLRLSPAEILSRQDPRRAELRGYGADVIRLWTQLASGEPIRIDSGGPGCETPEGVAWGGDRFSISGGPGRSRLEAFGFAPGRLYETFRIFPQDEGRPVGYRIPLPPGPYRVTLHFAEMVLTRAGRRAFDVLIEGKPCLQDYEPFQAGFATPQEKTFPADVADGFLDIEFVHRISHPIIAGLEIEKAD